MLKKLLIVIVVCLVLAVGTYVAWDEAERRRQPGVLRQAQQAYEEGDYKAMAMLLGEASTLDPDNLEAIATEARLYDAVGRVEAVDAYARLYQAQPDDFESLQNWLEALVRFDRASEALSVYWSLTSPDVQTPAFTQTVGFSILGAELAKAAGEDTAILTYLREAYERAPGDPLRALALSAWEATVLPPDELGPTAERLYDLLGNTAVRSDAAAALADIYRKQGNVDSLQAMAERLWEYGTRDIDARMLALNAFYETGRTDLYREKLATLIKEQERRSIAMARILAWLLEKEEYDTVIETALADETRLHFKRPPIAPVVAEAMIHANRLEDLRDYTETAEWTGEEGFGAMLNPLLETMSREKAQRFPNPEFNRWLRNAHIDEIQELLDVAVRLDMVREQESMLAEIIDRQPWERAGYDRLYALREARKDALGMYKLLDEAQRNFPGDRDLLNNHAYLALVLDIDRRAAVRVAEENFNHDPDNSEYRATQALALCMLRRPAKALDLLYVMDELPPRAMVTQALAHRMLDEREQHDDMLMELDPDIMLPAEWRMVIGTRQQTPDIEADPEPAGDADAAERETPKEEA